MKFNYFHATCNLFRFFLLIIIGILPIITKAQFSSLSTETLVNTTTAGPQEGYWWSVRTVAVQPDGGFIKVWIDKNNLDGQADGIFGQRFNASSAKIGPEFLVNTTTGGSQFSPSVAVAPNGSFVVAWEGPGASIDVWAQRFTNNGVKVGTEFLLNTTTSGNQRYPEVQFYGDGTFVAGFVDGAQTVLQRFDADGRPIGLETRISSGTGNVVMDGLCVRPDNSVLLTWSSGADVYGQLFTNTLQPIGTQTRINTYLTGTQEYIVARVDALGNFVAVWQSHGQDGSGIGVYGRRYDKNFNPISGEFAITTNITGNQSEPQVAVHPNGRFILVWTDYNNRDFGGGDNSSIWVREFTANGTPVGIEMRVNFSIIGSQTYPIIDMNASGRFVITWEGNGTMPGQIDNIGIFARSYQFLQTGTTAVTVSPASNTAGDLVTVTMSLSSATSISNVIPNPLSISGTNEAYATLVSGPTPSTVTVGATPVTISWTYRVTANESTGQLTFGGNAINNTGVIFPFASSNSITVKPSIYLSDITAPNLVNDANNQNAGPRVFTIGAKITNPDLNELTDVTVYLGDGVTAGTFPITSMTIAQTNNTYKGNFSLAPLAGISDCTRPIQKLGPAKRVMAGGIDFNNDGLVNISDDGILSNGKIVVDGRVDVNGSGTITATDDLPRPPGIYTGYREPALMDGNVDVNRDGIINAADNGTYGGETKNIYWQVIYAVKDLSSQPTFGNCGDFADDLRYNWVLWATGKDGGGITRNDIVSDFAKVRCELSAASNKLSPTSGGYMSGTPPRVIAGMVDVNSDDIISTADDGVFYSKTIIDGKVDINNSGTITITDDGLINFFPVIDGLIDVDRNGLITAADDGILVFPGETFSVTIRNASFGTIGNGFDENRDGLWDLDFWYQPIGSLSWPAASFRLVDVQSDLIGTGGSNPLNGITTHFDNEPYMTRLFDDRLNQGGGFDGNYTYTFLVLGGGSACISPYQEAASGTNNEKYNNDYIACRLNIITAPFILLPKESVALEVVKQGSYAYLSWKTTNMPGISQFYIEYSHNGIDFEKIGEVTAGTNNAYKDYKYLHTNTVNGVNYYRLKIIDNSNQLKFTDIKSLKFSDNGTVTVYPTITTGKVHIRHHRSNENLKVILYSADGKQIKKYEKFISGSSIDISGFSNNIYFIKTIETNGNITIKKIIKK